MEQVCYRDERYALQRALDCASRSKDKELQEKFHIRCIRPKSMKHFVELIKADKFEKPCDKDYEEESEWGFCPHSIVLRECPADEKGYEVVRAKLEEKENSVALAIKVLEPKEAFEKVEEFKKVTLH